MEVTCFAWVILFREQAARQARDEGRIDDDRVEQIETLADVERVRRRVHAAAREIEGASPTNQRASGEGADPCKKGFPLRGLALAYLVAMNKMQSENELCMMARKGHLLD